MRRTRTEFDSDIEAKGWDKIRSRLEVELIDGRKLVRDADERYRGGPDNPLSDTALQGKFTDCTESLLNAEAREKVFKAVSTFEQIEDIGTFVSLLCP